MKSRKILAMILAVMMLLGTTSALATQDAEGYETDPEGTGAIDGDGEVGDVNTKVYKVSLPTDADLGFYVDPVGYLGLDLTAGDVVSMDDLDPGKIIGKSNAVITNFSSRDMFVSFDMVATGANAAGGAADLVWTVDPDDVEDLASSPEKKDGANNLLLAVEASAEDVANDGDNFVSSGLAAALDETAAEDVLNFALAAAPYELTVGATAPTYAIEQDADGNDIPGASTAMKIAGLCNTEATWSAYDGSDGKIGIKFAYTIGDISEVDEDAAELVPFTFTDGAAVDPIIAAPAYAVAGDATGAGTEVIDVESVIANPVDVKAFATNSGGLDIAASATSIAANSSVVFTVADLDPTEQNVKPKVTIVNGAKASETFDASAMAAITVKDGKITVAANGVGYIKNTLKYNSFKLVLEYPISGKGTTPVVTIN